MDLLRRVAQRDDGALAQFYDVHAGMLFSLAVRILGDHQAAEDVVQEVFLQIWDHAAGFDPAQGRPIAWAITLTRNRAIDRLRSRQRRARLAEEAMELALAAADAQQASAVAGAERAGVEEEAGAVRAALGRLPADQRRAIELAFFGGLSQTEIADSLGEPLGTVKARIRRGMLKLRDELASHGRV